MTPEQLIFRLWAKTNDHDEGRTDGWQFHPLPCHLIDVGVVAEAWVDADPLLLNRFCRLWPDLDRDVVRRVLILSAALHDLGKVSPAFQAKSEEGWKHGYGTVWGNRPIPNGTGFDHGAATARLFDQLTDPLTRPVLTQEWRPLVDVMRISGAHHGRLFQQQGLSNMDVRITSSQVEGDTTRALLSLLASLFGSLPDIRSEPPSTFLMLAAGFISVVDWVGSDEWYFPFAQAVHSAEDVQRYLNGLRTRRPALRALRNAGLLGEFADREASFRGLFGFDPYPGFQEEALTVPFGEAEGAEMCVVEAPMGLGKTEIALALAASAMRKGTASGLYFALPTQASSNALFLRIETFTRKIASGNLALMLAHGTRRYFSDFRRLLEQTRIPFAHSRPVKTDRDAPQAEVISPGWLQSSKRALLAPVGLGTIDQAMLGAIGVRHAFVRLFALARKVVVFDEIHAYDLYMNVIIERLLAWLQVLDAKVILLSATLPESVHQRLAAAFGNAEISETVADPAPYPRLTLTRGATGIRSITSPIPGALTKTVRIEALETEDATRSGIDWLRAAIGRGGCVAWIRNTVREAQEAWHLLRDSGIEAQLLHSRFTRYDRNLKEEALIDMLGKPSDCSKRPPSLVVVATQVIEQSVDIDFDAMLSDLAPVDLLLQRAGRLWRHFDRPSEVRRGHREPVLAILLPDQDHRFRMEFGASAYVYDAETLSRSACLVLKSTYWDIPVDCRRLVAALYDRGAAYWSAERQGVDPVRLEDVRTKEKAAETRLTHRSKTILVSRPGVIPEMRDAMRDGDTDTDVALATRHGKRSQAVCLFKVAPEGLEAIGKPGKPCQLPQPDDFTDRLQFEEAIALSTVSLPPFTAGKDPVPTGVSELAEIATWWKRHHPYDDRLFVLLDGNGTSTLYAGTLLYSAEEGLRLARATSADASHTHEED